ncbi:hypothetical protein ACWIUD_10220 [Helicobacter sp. 23-1044]
MQKFYFSIKSVNVADYLNKAIIENIILRKKPFCFDSDNVCIGVALSESEKDSLKSLENDFFLYESPLPLSRTGAIIFENKEQLEQTIGTIELQTAFVLRDMCAVKTLEKFHNLDIKARESNMDKLKEFDRYLGAMAFLRYKANGDENLPCVFEYLDYFLGKSQMPFREFEKIKPFLEGKMLIDDVRHYADENNLKYKADLLGMPLKQDDELMDILAQISYYCGDEASKKLSDLLQVEPYRLPSENKFYFALGYFVGYSNFAKQELNKKIKFEFNKFDLRIIENIYSFVWTQNPKTQNLNKEIIDFIKDSSRVFSEHPNNLSIYLHDKISDSQSKYKEQLEKLSNEINAKIDSNHLHLQEKNKELDLKIDSNHLQLQGEINDLQSKAEKLQIENENLKKEIDLNHLHLQEQNKELDSKIDSKYLQLQNENKALKETLKLENETLKIEFTEKTENLKKELDSKHSQSQSEINNLQEKNKELDSKIDSNNLQLLDKISKLQVENTNLKKELDSNYLQLQNDIKLKSILKRAFKDLIESIKRAFKNLIKYTKRAFKNSIESIKKAIKKLKND